MTIQAVLFDLDGTLVDTAPDFVRIIQELCNAHQLPIPSEADIREQVSAGARAMVRLALGQPDIKDDDQDLLAMRQMFLEAYAKNICVDSRLFDGLDGLLDYLENKEIPWGIVTNKPRQLSEMLLEKLELSARCAVLVCPDDVKQTKPDPEPLFLACQQIGTDPQKTLYIGDHHRDIIAGKAANMPSIIAEYGYLSQDDRKNLASWGADYTAKTPTALVALVQSLV